MGFDKTIASRNDGDPIEKLGSPVWPMVKWVQYFLARGLKVVIFTARITDRPEDAERIQDWLESQANLPRLEVTNIKRKDFCMIVDDLAVNCIPNSGDMSGLGQTIHLQKLLST